MKIKQFFIDNKSKIKKVLQWFLIAVLFFVGSHFIYACGYYTRDKLDSSEESNISSHKLEIEKKKVLSGNVNTNMSTMITNIVTSSHAEGQLVIILHIDNVNLNYDFSELEFELEFTLVSRFYYSNNAYIEQYDSDLYGYIYAEGQFEEISDLNLSFYPNVVINEGALDDSLLNPSLDLSWEADVGVLSEDDVIIQANGIIGQSFTFNPTIPNQSHAIAETLVNFLTAIDDYGLTNMTFNNSISFNLDVYDDYYNNGYRVGFNKGKAEGYEEGYDVGFQEALPKNIFYYNVQKDSPYLLVLDDTSYTRPDDYDENLLFKNNYLDLQYLRTLYSGQYSKFRIIFTDFIYSLKDLYLSLDNSSLNDYNILVNGKAYSINSSGTLNISSSELLQVMEFDSSLLDSTRLINSSPDYANGFNNGYVNGYDNGYSQGEIDQEDYFEELIIPAVKLEYEEIGYDNGYIAGKNDALNSGSGVALFDAFTLIGKGFEAWNPILNIQVLPGLTLGVFIAIPIVIAVVMIVIKLLQR